MSNQYSIGIVILIVIFSLVSCKKVQTPTLVTIEDFNITKLGFKQSNVNLHIHYFNPNNYQIKLKNASGYAWLDGNSLGQFTIDSMIRIPANADFRLPVKLNLDMSNFIQNMSTAFMDKLVNLKIDGMARIGKGFFYINYPIKFEGKVDLKAMIK